MKAAPWSNGPRLICSACPSKAAARLLAYRPSLMLGLRKHLSSAVCARVAKLIAAHKGPAAMMSFSIEAVASIPDSIMRGQLIAPTNGDPSADLASTARVTVDYLACHTGDAANPSLQTARAATPLITWTVKDAEMCADLSKLTDSQIFEGFDPKLAKRHILNR